jgi:hypothetical protein
MTAVASRVLVGPAESTAEEKKIRPVLVWAVIGALFLAFIAWVMVRWIASGPTATHTGVTPVPTRMVVLARVFEVVAVLSVAFMGYRLIYRPWRRDGQLSPDGLMCLAALTLFWQDPMYNYGKLTFSYNSVYVNLGSWAGSVPGSLTPNVNLQPEPLIALIAAYYVWLIAPVILFCWVMRKAKARWPGMSNFHLVLLCFGMGMLADFTLEVIPILLGLYSFGGVPGPKLFAGKWYQFPLHEAFIFGAVYGSYGVLRYFKNDRGETIAERGAHDLKVSTGRRTFVRFLALTGVMQAIFTFVFTVPVILINFHSPEWTADTQHRSYFTNGLCGYGTDYACNGAVVPVPKHGSAHMGPDGTVIVPEGAELPKPVEPRGR